jgi:hypothetical protein
MQHATIRNLSRPQTPLITAPYCVSFLCRLRGLTFRQRLPIGQGLLLVQARDSRLDASIHMLFVWMDLAVVWINSAEQVVDVRLARSWRPAYLPGRPACYILEMAAEHLKDFYVGDKVSIEIA